MACECEGCGKVSMSLACRCNETVTRNRHALGFDVRMTLTYANSSGLGYVPGLGAGFNDLGLLLGPAHDLPCQWHQGLRDSVPGSAEHVGFVPGQSRPDLRGAWLRRHRRRQIRSKSADWLQSPCASNSDPLSAASP